MLSKEDKENIIEVMYGMKTYIRVGGKYAVAMEGDVCRDMNVLVEEGSGVAEAFYKRDVWTADRMERVVAAVHKALDELFP